MKYDVAIIGGGPAGYTAAEKAAAGGLSTVLFEKNALGGVCLNEGCVPTKTLLYSAKVFDTIKHAPKYAVSAENPAFDFPKIIARKNKVVKKLTAGIRMKMKENGVEVVSGEAEIKGRAADGTITIASGEAVYEAANLLICTGSETVIPDITGVKESQFVYTSTSIMELTELPKHLVIIGGGYIGLEFASMYASFGSKVTVLEGYPELIGREDRDIAASVQTVLEKKGIVFHLNAKVQYVDGATVIYEDAVTHEIHHLEGDAILLATGRRPNTSGLNLEVAGVKVNERGAIIVDEWLRTTNPAIRAIGDVKGGLQFTYISLDDYRIIREDLFGAGERRTDDREPVSYSVFMDPPLARVGLSETEARKKGLNIKVNTLPVAAIPRARTLGETDGLFKVVVDADTNKILGCSLFGPETSEIINIVSIVMKTGQEYTFLRDYIFTHPSMSEALNDLMNF